MELDLATGTAVRFSFRGSAAFVIVIAPEGSSGPFRSFMKNTISIRKTGIIVRLN